MIDLRVQFEMHTCTHIHTHIACISMLPLGLSIVGGRKTERWKRKMEVVVAYAMCSRLLIDPQIGARIRLIRSIPVYRVPSTHLDACANFSVTNIVCMSIIHSLPTLSTMQCVIASASAHCTRCRTGYKRPPPSPSPIGHCRLIHLKSQLMSSFSSFIFYIFHSLMDTKCCPGSIH